MKTRPGNHNLPYEKGFRIEEEKFTEYENLLLKVLDAEKIEATSRSIIDVYSGCDAVALIDNLTYGISLRYRNKDYNSFTLSRHVDDKYSEVHKWTQTTTNGNIKPAYHVQINERNNDEVRVIKINIEAFRLHLKYLIKYKKLENYFNSGLQAYEFRLDEDIDGILTKIINK